MKIGGQQERRTQWIACIAAIMSAICAGFSTYVMWQNSKHAELTVRPQLKLGTVVVHEYPSKTVLEIEEVKNVGAGDAQKCELTVFFRENWLGGKICTLEMRNLMRGEKCESLSFLLPTKFNSPDGEVTINDYFKKYGLQISATYENMWTREAYSENWDIKKWILRTHDVDQ